MQSGISASQELVAQFNELINSPTHFGLLATISNESLNPVRLLTPSGAAPSPSLSFSSNLSLLAPHLKDNEALYAILRRYDSDPAFVAATYIPDGAPVRQKMLFASTRLAFVRELGTEHFRETILADSASELSAAGFKEHDVHTALEAPMTEEERTLGAVKRAEFEAGRGSGRKEIHLSSQMSMPIAEDALEALKSLGNGSKNIVMMKINSDTETVILAPNPHSSTPSSISDLTSAISADQPRFTFYRYTHTHNGEDSSPILFIYTCPTTATYSIKNRMMYPLMAKAVITMAEECGVKTDKKFEVEGPSELTEQTVLDDLHPKMTVKQGFARPKRPGR